MSQTLTTDTVERVIPASPDLLYDIIADVTRMPEMSPEIVSCTWVRGATGPRVGARFRSINRMRWFRWPNWPVVIAATPGREFAVRRTEPFFGHSRMAVRLRAGGGCHPGHRVLHRHEPLDARRLVPPRAWHGGH